MKSTLYIAAAAIFLCVAAADTVPYFYHTKIIGPEGVKITLQGTDRPWMPTKILIANADPTNGVVVLERVSAGGTIVESVSTATADASPVAATNSVIVYAGDTLWINRPGSGGTVSNAVIQIHGDQYRRFP